MAHLTIACGDCALRHSTACTDCLVTFVLRADNALTGAPADVDLDLDPEQERVVELFARAGLVPRLRHLAS
mgnify:CR=1 FL=1